MAHARVKAAVIASLLLALVSPVATAQSGTVGFFTPGGENPDIAADGLDTVFYDLYVDVGSQSQGSVRIRFFYADHPSSDTDLAVETTVYLKPPNDEWPAKPSWCAAFQTVQGTPGWCRIPGNMGQNNAFDDAGASDEVTVDISTSLNHFQTPSGTRDGVFRARLQVEVPNFGGTHPTYLSLRSRPATDPSQGGSGVSATVTTAAAFRKTFVITALTVSKLEPAVTSVADGTAVNFKASVDGTKAIQKFELDLGGTLFLMNPVAGQPRQAQLTRTLFTALHTYRFVFTFTDGKSLASASFQIEAGVHQPQLSNGQVTPSTGTAAQTVFTYSVVYTDLQNHAPTKRELHIDTGAPLTMSTSDPDFTNGAVFTHSTPLGEGSHIFFFRFNDGVEADIQFPDMGTLPGPTVSAAPPPTTTTPPPTTTATTTTTPPTTTTTAATTTTSPPPDPCAAVPVPSISGVSTTEVTRTSAKITWSLSGSEQFSVRSFVEYGTTPSYGSTTPPVQGPGAKSLTLTGLTPTTLYHYRVQALDDCGHSAQSGDATFTTVLPITLTLNQALVVSRTSVLFEWSLQGPSDAKSHLEWGTTSSLGQKTSDQNGPGTKSQALTGLTHKSTLHYQIVATDPFGQVVKTPVASLVVDVPLAIRNVGDSFLSPTNRLISWKIEGFSDAQSFVEYGTTFQLGSRTTAVAGIGDKTTTLSGLIPATQYHYRIVATDADGDRVESEIRTFLSSTPPRPPRVANITVDVKLDAVLITWDVDGEPGVTSRLEYGTTVQYGTRLDLHTGRGPQSDTLTLLVAGVMYHFRIVATNPDGTTFATADAVFTTLLEAKLLEIDVVATAPIPEKVLQRELLFFSFKLPNGTRAAFVELVDPDTGAVATRIELQPLTDPATGEVFWTGQGTADTRGVFDVVVGFEDPSGRIRRVDQADLRVQARPGTAPFGEFGAQWVLAVLALLAVLGGGGYLLYQRVQSKIRPGTPKP